MLLIMTASSTHGFATSLQNALRIANQTRRHSRRVSTLSATFAGSCRSSGQVAFVRARHQPLPVATPRGEGAAPPTVDDGSLCGGISFR